MLNDLVILTCPKTGISIREPRQNGYIIEYNVHCSDGSFLDNYDTILKAINAAAELNPDFCYNNLQKKIVDNY